MMDNDENISVFSWQDEGLVYGISTAFPQVSQTKIMRHTRMMQDDGSYQIQTWVPPAMKAYGDRMTYVDTRNQLCSGNYGLDQFKCQRASTKAWLLPVDLDLVQTWLLFKHVHSDNRQKCKDHAAAIMEAHVDLLDWTEARHERRKRWLETDCITDFKVCTI